MRPVVAFTMRVKNGILGFGQRITDKIIRKPIQTQNEI
jgi:hypothetical protein